MIEGKSYYTALVGALIWGREDMYQNNVHFHEAIRALVPLVEILVDGLADQAKTLGERDERRIAQLSARLGIEE